MVIIGTKMGNLVYYINQQIQNEKDTPRRFIIFSQWDEMLQLIGNTLTENGISNVFVSGNVHSKNNAITTFQNENNVRVIMLSLKNSAAGTNLTEATHVIFTDPVAGSFSLSPSPLSLSLDINMQISPFFFIYLNTNRI